MCLQNDSKINNVMTMTIINILNLKCRNCYFCDYSIKSIYVVSLLYHLKVYTIFLNNRRILFYCLW